MDIVFVHGLGGHWRTTWEGKRLPSPATVVPVDAKQRSEGNGDAKNCFWPEWIAEAMPTAEVWSLDYEADRTNWWNTFSLGDHGRQAFSILTASDFGRRPIVFVTHSLGGLVVKSLLQESHDGTGNAKLISKATRGVVFFATPNSGSRIATGLSYVLGMLGPIGQMVRPSRLVQVLKANEPELLQLNRWYRDRVTDTTASGLRIANRVFCEKRGLLGLISIVDETSADPGIGGVHPIPVPEDHFAICKLSEPGHWIFKSVVKFVSECIPSRPLPASPTNDDTIIEVLVPKGLSRIRLVIDENVIPSSNVTFRVSRSDGVEND
jgi:hypothetical protein